MTVRTFDEETDLRIERTVPAPPDRVFAALTEPAQLAAWFWPEKLGLLATAEPRAGGDYRLDSPSARMAVSGRYESVRPERLVFSWRWDGEDHESRVTIELSAMDGDTRLALDHVGLADSADRDNHVKGWSDCLDRLPGFLASRR